uniref:GRF1-interacting factor 2 n=3 Tax=Caenorhabditis tropicalis TaxID=1561998 RepID=A0A1I7UH50_9PELO
MFFHNFRNQEKYNKMNMQQGQGPTVEQQITKINARLKAAKTNQERELVFYDLKKNPSLFHEWLRIHGNGQNSNMIAQGPAPQLQNSQKQKFQQQQQYQQQHLQLQQQMQQLHLQRLQQIQRPQQMEQQAGGMGDSNFASTPNCNQSRNTFGYFDD